MTGGGRDACVALCPDVTALGQRAFGRRPYVTDQIQQDGIHVARELAYVQTESREPTVVPHRPRKVGRHACAVPVEHAPGARDPEAVEDPRIRGQEALGCRKLPRAEGLRDVGEVASGEDLVLAEQVDSRTCVLQPAREPLGKRRLKWEAVLLVIMILQ